MSNWEILDISDGDPTPGDPASIRAVATDFRRRSLRVNGHAQRLQRTAANSGAMALRGEYAASINRQVERLPADATALAVAYQACAEAMIEFASAVDEQQMTSRNALQRGIDADSQYRGVFQQFRYLAGVAPPYWRDLTFNYAAQCGVGRPAEFQSVLRQLGGYAQQCEANRQAARNSALQAKGLYEAAAARCAAAIRAAALPNPSMDADSPIFSDRGSESSSGTPLPSEAEQRRRHALGMDPATRKFRVEEEETAVRLEQELGVTLARAPAGSSADWIDEAGRTYDSVGNFPAQFFAREWPRLQYQMVRHVNHKADLVPVDVSKFTPAQVALVEQFITDRHLGPRVFIVGR